jgi:(E)-4-hydroxy-3-methylbut-2-enyl-diphosphate synthase
MIFSRGEPLKKVATENLVDELFAEIDKFYAAGQKIVVDEKDAAEAREWLKQEEDETAMTPERLAQMEKDAADGVKPEIDEAASPQAGRRFSRA